MAAFLVEAYLPSGDGASDLDELFRASDALTAAGTRVVRTIFVPRDETCYILCEADSVTLAQAAAEHAGLRVARVSEAVVATAVGR